MTAPDLAAFLLARIEADEAAARVALAGPWVFGDDGHSLGQVTGGTFTIAVRDATAHTADLNHIARHNPARVLAECAARRTVVSMCSRGLSGRDVEGASDDGDNGPWVAQQTLRALAQPYAGEPGWRDEWVLT